MPNGGKNASRYGFQHNNLKIKRQSMDLDVFGRGIFRHLQYFIVVNNTCCFLSISTGGLPRSHDDESQGSDGFAPENRNVIFGDRVCKR